MSYEIQPGDYVAFTRIVTKAVNVKIKDASGKDHGYQAEEREVIQRSGSGIVNSINKGVSVIRGQKVRLGSVDAGPVLGKSLKVVMDDAVLVGKQQSMFDMAADSTGIGMYGQDAKGGA